MKRKFIYLMSGIALTMILWACGNDKSKEQGHKSDEQQESESASTITPSLIYPVVQHYIHFKNALVASNLEEAKAGAKGILDALHSTDTSAFSAEQKAVWNEQADKVKENAEHIIGTPELAHQREHLGPLTEGMYALIKVFGGSKTMYYEFCPMANDNKGGYWISESEEIKNPYFGDEMLNCGEIKETIK